MPHIWYNQMSWAAGLNDPGVLTYSINPGVTLSWGIGSSWRLPNTDESVINLGGGPGYKGPDQNGNYDYEWGFNMLNSEMGHLFYVSLGNIGIVATDGTYKPDGWGLANTGPFTSFVSGPAGYWSRTEYSPDPNYAWAFGTYDGNQGLGPKYHNFYALAVRPGIVAVPIAIDIKPGSDPNSIDLKSKGKIPVAILSTEEFDAPSQVDPYSLTFGATGNEPSLAFCNPKGEDINGDGLKDLVCHFYTEKAGFDYWDEEGVLIGKLLDITGTLIGGTDSVRIVPCN